MVLQISLHFNSNLFKIPLQLKTVIMQYKSGGKKKFILLAIFTKSERMSLAHRFGTSLTLAENSP